MNKKDRKKKVANVIMRRGREREYVKLPSRLADLGEGYKALMRELSRR